MPGASHSRARPALSLLHCRTEVPMLKVFAWIIGIIFLIGLLVVLGVIDLAF